MIRTLVIRPAIFLATVVTAAIFVAWLSSAAMAWCDKDAERRNDKVQEAASLCEESVDTRVTGLARDRALVLCMRVNLLRMHATDKELQSIANLSRLLERHR